MNVEIITIGDELLIGQVIDTNSAWMGRELNQAGFFVHKITSVGDRLDEICAALQAATEQAKIILITGGLGPTKDDITKNAMCRFFNTDLVFNEKVFAHVQDLFERRNVKMPAINRMQAMLPANCKAIDNSRGTAPGMWFEHNGCVFVSMPGVPSEMKGMMSDYVIPELRKKFKPDTILHKTLLTAGIGESALAEKIASWEDQLPEGFRLAYLPAEGMVRLRLTVRGKENSISMEQVNAQFQKLENIIPDHWYGYDESSLEESVGKLLTQHGWKLCIAESCTGGSISRLITRIPGSSDYYNGGVVAYSYDAKENILGVKAETLNTYGAVSEQAVREMAEGAKRIFNSECAIATSGIAGPGGGTPDKPVGTIWIAISTPEQAFTRKFVFGKSREINILHSSNTVLNLLRLSLKQSLKI